MFLLIKFIIKTISFAASIITKNLLKIITTINIYNGVIYIYFPTTRILNQFMNHILKVPLVGPIVEGEKYLFSKSIVHV